MYSSITTFQEIHNIFLFNVFLFYQLFESCQGFIFDIYFNWKTPSENRFLLLKPREISEYKTRAWMSKWNLHLIEIWPQTMIISHDSHVPSLSWEWIPIQLCNQNPSPSSAAGPRDSQELCEFGDHPSRYGTALLLDQYARICTCHAGLVLTKIHRKPGSPLTDTHSPSQTE